MVHFIKTLLIWFFNNRGLGYKYIRAGLEVAKIASKMTKNTVDDQKVRFIAEKAEEAMKLLPPDKQKEFIDQVNKDNNILKGVKLGYTQKNGVSVSVDF